MPPVKRMTANPARPTRHRAGKHTGASSDSNSDTEASAAEEPVERTIAPPPKVPSAGKIVSDLSKVDLAERRRHGQEAEDRRQAAAKAAKLAAEDGFVTEESEDGESNESEDDSEEGSSEDEAPRRLLIKPKFIPKHLRHKDGKEPLADDQDGGQAAEEEEERKKKAMDEIVEEQLRKDAAARAAGKKHWDDLIDEEEDVDTEDDVDPEAEYAAWKLRELKRIKREREAIEKREREREEVERRRNLTEEERKAEDEAYLAQQKEDKDGKGKAGFMQKYFHRGAFFQDDEVAEQLAKRDVMGARFQDEVKNRELLPKALQMRDMTKLGKKGASKYRDLKSEDTGRWGDLRDTKFGRERRDFDHAHVDDRYKSDRFRESSRPGGANAVPLGERKGGPSAPLGSRNTGRDGDSWKSDRRERSRSRERETHRSRGDNGHDSRRNRCRSRSRSPRQSRDDSGRKKRDSSRDGGRYESDKRRRVDSR
ncbi:splicing factor, Prp19-binding domain-containing protein [Xylariaceae sp. FL1019]|nr:splicing factor, Prp19-binding domain-containing protein [Xylariaceae sp. FL1019]